MTRIIMSGCTGKMGRVITAAVKEKADCKIVAGIDLRVPEQSEYPVFSSPEEMQSKRMWSLIFLTLPLSPLYSDMQKKAGCLWYCVLPVIQNSR